MPSVTSSTARACALPGILVHGAADDVGHRGNRRIGVLLGLLVGLDRRLHEALHQVGIVLRRDPWS